MSESRTDLSGSGNGGLPLPADDLRTQRRLLQSVNIVLCRFGCLSNSPGHDQSLLPVSSGECESAPMGFSKCRLHQIDENADRSLVENEPGIVWHHSLPLFRRESSALSHRRLGPLPIMVVSYPVKSDHL